MQVRHPPEGDVLRITPPCEDGWKVCQGYVCATKCKKWAELKCGQIAFPEQHLDALDTCEGSVASSNCSSSAPGTGTTFFLGTCPRSSFEGCYLLFQLPVVDQTAPVRGLGKGVWG